MRDGARVVVIIPALNEAPAIESVLAAIPDWVDRVIVVDNGSTDRTADVARKAGADVVVEPRRGYGSACLAGMDALGEADVVVFLDGDASDRPEEMASLVDPIVRGDAEMVIGSRVLGLHEPGSLTVQQWFGNRLACVLIRFFWRVRHTDLGPFRAVRTSSLRAMVMRDRNYGWTVEMQVKAARSGMRVGEVPVSYRRRIGVSKVSGTIRGTLGAGWKILGTIFLAVLDPTRFASGTRREGLIVYSRYPAPGECKTRLIGTLGAAGAAALQRRMTEHVMRQVRTCADRRRAALEVHYAGGDADQMRAWLGRRPAYVPQARGDLGERMGASFRDAFEQGIDRVVLVGTDCPEITPDILDQAAGALTRADLVLGPADDGGYYLIGIRRSARQKALPHLFAGIPWSTSAVLDDTLRAARRLDLRVELLPVLRDVDRPEDIEVWQRLSRSALDTPLGVRISVIIATLNEEPLLEGTLAGLRDNENIEVIVVDGGSSDGTIATAERLGVTVLTRTGGRGAQFNAGAARATGDTLLFLHADTRLPADFATQVHSTLSVPGVSAGAFGFCIDAPGFALRLIERLVGWRCRLLQMPYGDQAIFMTAATFAQVGGFPEIPLMEDYEIVRRLRRLGRVALAPGRARISARRWLRVGPWRTTIVNQLILAGYGLGVPPERLKRFYMRF